MSVVTCFYNVSNVVSDLIHLFNFYIIYFNCFCTRKVSHTIGPRYSSHQPYNGEFLIVSPTDKSSCHHTISFERCNVLRSPVVRLIEIDTPDKGILLILNHPTVSEGSLVSSRVNTA